MTIKYYNELMQGGDEWHKKRLGIITGSQVKQLVTPTGKIADNNDSRTIVYEKVAERITNIYEDGFGNFHTERGNTFEPFARDLYSKEHAQVRECGFVTRQFDGFMIGYSPDGLVGEDGLIEIICPAQPKHVKEICEQKEPKEKWVQMQTGLLVTKRKWCDFISHYNGMHQRIVRIYPDLQFHELIQKAALNLEGCIEKNIKIYNEYTNGMPKAKYQRGI